MGIIRFFWIGRIEGNAVLGATVMMMVWCSLLLLGVVFFYTVPASYRLGHASLLPRCLWSGTMPSIGIINVVLYQPQRTALYVVASQCTMLMAWLLFK